MDFLQANRVFLRVAELGSFTQAADQLALPKASVSAAVQQLEAQLGTRLLHRTTRRVQLTQDGLSYRERAQDLLADADELQTLFQAGEAAYTGRLRVDMSVGIARHIVVPRLPEFLAAHPHLELQLSSTDRRVDLVREGFDCVVRVGTLADSSLVARTLGRLRVLTVASPAYLAAHGVPESPDELDRHRLVGYTPLLGAKPEDFEYRAADGSLRTRAMPLSLVVDNSEAYMAACLAGLGLIQAPETGLAAALTRGDLVEVLPGFRADPMPVSLLYANRRQLPKRLQAFLRWLESVLKPHLV
ncbi:LysR family transcriptional regulator [Tahibacter caeni]|uniref:LysR family transcriptional regulator n=1 Tax=Tahibacter caeni TaxID=1453545 RepID=UPI0021489694